MQAALLNETIAALLHTMCVDVIIYCVIILSILRYINWLKISLLYNSMGHRF